MWIPLVLLGSILYWGVALSLGGMSLSLLGGSAEEELALQPFTVEERIDVDLRKRSELCGAGGNQASDDGTGRLPAIDNDEPPAPPAEDPIGRTAY